MIRKQSPKEDKTLNHGQIQEQMLRELAEIKELQRRILVELELTNELNQYLDLEYT